jgi:ABC-type antimicrobial peptide transport system permease subunit
MNIVMRGALGQIALGLLLGLPAAFFAGRMMASLLYGISRSDPFAIIAATLVLALCAAVAGFIPARRAASIEPMSALRTE